MLHFKGLMCLFIFVIMMITISGTYAYHTNNSNSTNAVAAIKNTSKTNKNINPTVRIIDRKRKSINNWPESFMHSCNKKDTLCDLDEYIEILKNDSACSKTNNFYIKNPEPIDSLKNYQEHFRRLKDYIVECNPKIGEDPQKPLGLYDFMSGFGRFINEVSQQMILYGYIMKCNPEDILNYCETNKEFKRDMNRALKKLFCKMQKKSLRPNDHIPLRFLFDIIRIINAPRIFKIQCQKGSKRMHRKVMNFLPYWVDISSLDCSKGKGKNTLQQKCAATAERKLANVDHKSMQIAQFDLS